MQLPLQDGTNWEVPQHFYAELINCYQRSAVDNELAKMRLWLNGNEKRRKTQRGIKRFVVAWLAKAGLPYKLKVNDIPSCCLCSRQAVARTNGASYCAIHAPTPRLVLA